MKIELNGTTVELDDNFVNLTEEIKKYLTDVKAKFDAFDKKNNNRESRISFVLENKDEIFQKLTSHFTSIWQIADNFNKDKYKLHAEYYRRELGELLLRAEINKHILDKPLGYAGDYVTMNYIYDYHDNFLGISSHDILINHYTCNIPISSSNIKRKKYFKHQILKVLDQIERPKIVSLGSGPVRELIELLDEGKINKPLSFHCIDFEPKALSFVKDEMSKRKKNNYLNIDYLKMDIRDIARSERIHKKINNVDFIYASGVFDYLSDRFAKKLTHVLYGLLNDSGYIIIVNASSKNSEMRAYYEMLGGWVFHHRTKKQLLEWTKDMDNLSTAEFEEPFPPNNYLFLKISK